MAHFIPGPHHVKHPMNQTNIMLQPGGFRAVTGGPSIFGSGYCYGGNYGNYGSYGYGDYGCCNADDGKLTFGQKVGSFFKGIGNTIKGAVKNLFTPKGLLTTALCVGACFIPGVGPFIAAGLACVGIAKGAGTVIKGAQQASQATTDAEAMAAWENIGGGTFTVAASAVALKGATGAIKANTASAGLSTTKGMTATQKLSTHWKGATQTYKNSGFSTKVSNTVGNLRAKGSTAYQTVKTKVTNTYNNFKNRGTQTQQTGLQVYDPSTNASTAGTTASSAWSKVQTSATKAWNTTVKYGNAAYKNIKSNPWTAKAGATTLLDPEEANMQYGINGYYV